MANQAEIAAAWLAMEDAEAVGWRWFDVMKAFRPRLERLEDERPAEFEKLWARLRAREQRNVARYRAAQERWAAVAGPHLSTAPVRVL